MDYDYNKLNKARKRMVDNGENLSWCQVYFARVGRGGNYDESIGFVRWYGDIIHAWANGKEFNVNDPAELNRFARIINEDYDDYNGYTDAEIINNADPVEEGCACCPYFLDCAAFDDVGDDEDEDEEA